MRLKLGNTTATDLWAEVADGTNTSFVSVPAGREVRAHVATGASVRLVKGPYPSPTVLQDWEVVTNGWTDGVVVQTSAPDATLTASLVLGTAPEWELARRVAGAVNVGVGFACLLFGSALWAAYQRARR